MNGRITRWAPVLALCLAGPVLDGSPAQAATWTIGPSIGFDVYSASGGSSVVLSAPSGAEQLLGGFRPGLRVGARDASERHLVFADLGALSLTGTGSSFQAVSGTINYAHAFMAGSSPYVTAGVGFSYVGVDGSSEVATLMGLGLGMRQRLGHGHGAIRVEGRYDRASNPDFVEPLNILGVRVGFDLDLN